MAHPHVTVTGSAPTRPRRPPLGAGLPGTAGGRLRVPPPGRRHTLRGVTTPPAPPPDPSRPGDDRPEQGGAHGYGQPGPASYGEPAAYGQAAAYGQPIQYGQPDPYGQQQGGYGAPQKSNGLGIASLVLGILSLPGAFFLGVPGIVLGLLAIILGIVALRRVKARRADNRGMPIGGIVTGAIGLVLGAIILAAAVFFVTTAETCIDDFSQTGDQAAYEQCLQDATS